MREPEAANPIVSSWRHRRPFARRCGFGIDEIGIFNFFSPTHTPPPGFLGSEPKFAEPTARPKGAALRAAAKLVSDPNNPKRGASCGRVFKVGKSELDCALPSKWLQRKPEAHRSISARQQRAVKRLNGLQQIEKPLNSFDGNVPMRAFFPPLKTRPNVAVSSLSAPAGVERVGVRGGIQRKKNMNAANSQVDKSSPVSHRAQEMPLKTEHITHTGQGLEAKNIQTNAVLPPAGSTSRSGRRSP